MIILQLSFVLGLAYRIYRNVGRFAWTNVFDVVSRVMMVMVMVRY